MPTTELSKLGVHPNALSKLEVYTNALSRVGVPSIEQPALVCPPLSGPSWRRSPHLVYPLGHNTFTNPPLDAKSLKVHKHEIILNFCLTEIKSLYALRKFSKKISLLFLRFSPEFRCSNISAVTEHTRNQIFVRDIQKFFFFKIFTLVLLDRFLGGFSKFGFFISEICLLISDF